MHCGSCVYNLNVVWYMTDERRVTSVCNKTASHANPTPEVQTYSMYENILPLFFMIVFFCVIDRLSVVHALLLSKLILCLCTGYLHNISSFLANHVTMKWLLRMMNLISNSKMCTRDPNYDSVKLFHSIVLPGISVILHRYKGNETTTQLLIIQCIVAIMKMQLSFFRTSVDSLVLTQKTPKQVHSSYSRR